MPKKLCDECDFYSSKVVTERERLKGVTRLHHLCWREPGLPKLRAEGDDIPIACADRWRGK